MKCSLCMSLYIPVVSLSWHFMLHVPASGCCWDSLFFCQHFLFTGSCSCSYYWDICRWCKRRVWKRVPTVTYPNECMNEHSMIHASKFFDPKLITIFCKFYAFYSCIWKTTPTKNVVTNDWKGHQQVRYDLKCVGSLCICHDSVKIISYHCCLLHDLQHVIRTDRTLACKILLCCYKCLYYFTVQATTTFLSI